MPRSIAHPAPLPAVSAGSALHWIAAGFAVLFAVVMYWPTVAAMLMTWERTATYTHCYLVIPIAAFLAWLERERLKTTEVGASFAGVLMVAAAVLGWLAGRLLDVIVVQQYALVGMIPAIVWACCGSRALRVLAWPLGYLVFLVPVGEEVMPQLMGLTADFVVFALRLSDIPVFQDGFYFSIPSGDFEVAKSCSGIHYLIATMALGVLFARLSYRSWQRRAAFIALCVMVPLIANGLRAYVIVLIAHLSDMRLAVGVDHLIYGWAFFGFVMAILFWIGSAFREPGAAKPGNDGARAAGHAGRMPAVRLLLAVCGVCGVAWLGVALAEEAALYEPRVQSPGSLPDRLPGWSAAMGTEVGWHPTFQEPDVALRGVYREGISGPAVVLDVIAYTRPRQGRELVNSENSVFDGRIWRRSATYPVSVAVGEQTLHAVASEIRAGGERRIVWMWYLSGERATRSGLLVKLEQAGAFVFRRPLRQAAIIVSVAADESQDSSRRSLQRFTQVSAPLLLACLGNERTDGCWQNVRGVGT